MARTRVAGIFVGGASRRMGGVPKGLLRAPDSGEQLVQRLAHLAGDAGLEPVLVGRATAYAHLGILAIADEPAGIGPLGGLQALLSLAGDDAAIALACDMPFVTRALLVRLATEHDGACVVAPRSRMADRWEPLLARYDSPRVLPVVREAIQGGMHVLQRVLSLCDVAELRLSADERRALTDWDSPEDIDASM